MKRFLCAALLAAACAAVSAEARASDCCLQNGSCGPGGGLCVTCWIKRLWPSGGACCQGVNPLNVHGCLAGPWYSYWPYEAHFMTAAPVAGAYPFGCSYPYWPAGGGYSFPGYGYPAGPTDYFSQTAVPPGAPGMVGMPGAGYPAGGYAPSVGSFAGH